MSADRSFRPGEPVALRPRKGHTTPTYAEVVEHSASTVRVIVTADSGGRKRGASCAVPANTLAPRVKGKHRKPARHRPRRPGWWGR